MPAGLLREPFQHTFTSSKATIETLENRREIGSKLTTLVTERRQRCRPRVFTVYLEHTSKLGLLLLLLTLNR